MPVWLVTGGSGFLGRHLLAELERAHTPDSQVIAIGRRRPAGWPIEAFAEADLDDPAGLISIIRGIEPDGIFHLAGRTPPAWPTSFYRSNTRATVNLLDALRAEGRPTRVILAGSAAELGPVPVEDLPVGEDHACRPRDAYGLSKWFACAFGLAQGPPLEVLSARIFNPIGPGLPASQALGRFASRLAQPDADPSRLVVGDLEARRDFIDARDVARALVALAIRGRGGRIYNVGTGRSHAVGEGLEHLIRRSGRRVLIEQSPYSAAMRGPADSRADIRRIREETGWEPSIAWERSLDDLWDSAASSPVAASPGRQVA